MPRWLWIVIVIGVTAGVIWGVQSQPGVPVETMQIEQGEIRTYIEERAKTRLPEIYKVTMPLTGRVQRITLLEGDAVSAGEVVAEMDAADLETDLLNAKSQVQQFDELLASLDAMFQAAQTQVRASSAKFEFNDGEYRRQITLKERNAVTDSIFNAAKLEMIESRIENERDGLIVKAVAAIRTATTLGQQDADETRKQRQRDRDRATLLAPVSGTVLTRNNYNQRVLNAGSVLLEIGRLQDLEVVVEALTEDAVRIPPGAEVEISGPTIGDGPVRGTVTRIHPQGFTKISSLGVEQQRVLVVVHFNDGVLQTLAQRGRALQSDYRVKVRIFVDHRSQTVIAPRSALFRSSTGSWQTFVVRDGYARRTDVEVGLINEHQAEILSGVEDGETVIVAPPGSLEDNSRVEATAISPTQR